MDILGLLLSLLLPIALYFYAVIIIRITKNSINPLENKLNEMQKRIDTLEDRLNEMNRFKDKEKITEDEYQKGELW